MEKLEKFKELGLSDETLKALAAKGFEEPTQIQALTIPTLIKGEVDLIGQAQTGTGKTAAFGLPIIEKADPKKNCVQAIILAPTRELAIQVSEELNSLKGKKKLQIVPIYGGQSIDQQFRRLKKGVDIVVGTPGRVIDHINRKTLKLGEVDYLILDEADEMLNMGFVEDMEEIMKHTNPEKRTLLFSATMPQRILNLAKNYMREYEVMAVKKSQLTTNLTDQIYFEVNQSDKFEALCRIVDMEPEFYGLIFCRTKNDCDNVSSRLTDRGYDADAIHGDVSQALREKILDKFKKKKINILVATDVAARGIDINDLTHVINYSLPQDPESYVHRIGRTGRAGKEGTAITFVTPAEYRKLLFIQRVAKTDIRKAKIPRVKDIIKAKKVRIKEELHAIMETEDNSEYLHWANDMLGKYEAQDILASMLKFAFDDELDVSNYSEIREVRGKKGSRDHDRDRDRDRRGFDKRGSSVDTKGTARLFVALGKKDNMAARRLVELIKSTSGVHDRKINDVQVFDKFSFITVPFAEAEKILHSFNKDLRGKKPIVTHAKKRK